MIPPDPDRMCETFVRIGPLPTLADGRHIDVVRSQVAPLIAHLTANRIADWYCLLIHDRNTGVPTRSDDDDAFWHVRFSFRSDALPEVVLPRLPTQCEMTRRIDRADIAEIAGLTTSKLYTGDIRDAWRIVGEQSEWLLRVVEAYRADLPWPELWPEIRQYLHYYKNMTQLAIA